MDELFDGIQKCKNASSTLEGIRDRIVIAWHGESAVIFASKLNEIRGQIESSLCNFQTIIDE